VLLVANDLCAAKLRSYLMYVESSRRSLKYFQYLFVDCTESNLLGFLQLTPPATRSTRLTLRRTLARWSQQHGG
jgi:hypothetical protein